MPVALRTPDGSNRREAVVLDRTRGRDFGGKRDLPAAAEEGSQDRSKQSYLRLMESARIEDLLAMTT